MQDSWFSEEILRIGFYEQPWSKRRHVPRVKKTKTFASITIETITHLHLANMRWHELSTKWRQIKVSHLSGWCFAFIFNTHGISLWTEFHFFMGNNELWAPQDGMRSPQLQQLVCSSSLNFEHDDVLFLFEMNWIIHCGIHEYNVIFNHFLWSAFMNMSENDSL